MSEYIKKYSLIIIFYLIVSGVSYAEEVLVCESVYVVTSPYLTVKMDQQVFRDGKNKYRVINKASKLFSKITEYSRYSIKSDGSIQPVEYFYNQKIFGVETTRSIEFDWYRLIAKAQINDRLIEIPLVVEMLDPISYQSKLKADLIIGREALEYVFIKRGRVIRYMFKRDKITTLIIDEKVYRNIQVVVKVDGATGGGSTTVWLDADQNYEILKIEKIREGKATTLKRIKTTCVNRV